MDDCWAPHTVMSSTLGGLLQDFGLGVGTRAAGAVVAGRARSRLQHDSGALPSSSDGEATQVLL